MEKRLWIENWGPSKDRGHHETRDAQGHLNIKGRAEKEELQLENGQRQEENKGRRKWCPRCKDRGENLQEEQTCPVL